MVAKKFEIWEKLIICGNKENYNLLNVAVLLLIGIKVYFSL